MSLFYVTIKYLYVSLNYVLVITFRKITICLFILELSGTKINHSTAQLKFNAGREQIVI